MACFHVWCGFEGRHCDKCAPKAAGRAGGDVRYTLIQTLKAVGGIHNPEANASIIADAVIAALALPAPVVEGARWPDPKFVPVEGGAKLNPDRVKTAFQIINGELVIGEQFQLIEMLLDGTEYTLAALSEGRSHG